MYRERAVFSVLLRTGDLAVWFSVFNRRSSLLWMKSSRMFGLGDEWRWDAHFSVQRDGAELAGQSWGSPEALGVAIASQVESPARGSGSALLRVPGESAGLRVIDFQSPYSWLIPPNYEQLTKSHAQHSILVCTCQEGTYKFCKLALRFGLNCAILWPDSNAEGLPWQELKRIPRAVLIVCCAK